MSGTRRPLSKKSRNSHANAMTGTMEPQLPSRLVHKYVATLDNLCNVCGPAMKPTHARLNHACDDKRMQIGAISTLGAFPQHSGPYGSATTTPRHSSAFSVMSSICNIDVVHIVRRYGIHVQHIFRLGTAFAHTTPSVRHGIAARRHGLRAANPRQISHTSDSHHGPHVPPSHQTRITPSRRAPRHPAYRPHATQPLSSRNHPYRPYLPFLADTVYMTRSMHPNGMHGPCMQFALPARRIPLTHRPGTVVAAGAVRPLRL